MERPLPKLENIDPYTIPDDISLRVENHPYSAEQFEGSGPYTDIEILHALREGHIRVHPFSADNLNATSYDVTLGEWFFVADKGYTKPTFNAFDRDDVKRYFGEPKRAMPHAQLCQEKGLQLFKGITPTHPVIALYPHERILAHTHEFIGINPPGTTHMQARSTAGRIGIVVCKDAGWGDPGYRGRWTMEIQNDNDETVLLPVGWRIAQMVFLHTGRTSSNYGSRGKYYRSNSLDRDILGWQPESMLPKAYEDELRLPKPLEEGVEINIPR